MKLQRRRAEGAQAGAWRPWGNVWGSVWAAGLGGLAWLLGPAALAQSVAPARAAQPATVSFQKLNLNDTGRTTCLDPSNGSRLPCAGSGQDGEFGRDVSNPRKRDGRAGFSFVKIAADGTELPPKATAWSCVKDKVTGLVWEVKTDEGGLRDQHHTYTDYRDGRPGDASEFVPAVNAAGLCGATDWRLPTAWELQSLVDYGQTSPNLPIDTAWFPHTVGQPYRTSTGVVGFPPGRWSVQFASAPLPWVGGEIDNLWGQSDALPVRLVRGARWAQGDRFVPIGAEVTDRMTGLVWRRCAEGQTWDGSGCGDPSTATRYTWQGALDQARAAAAGGTGWRLPNVKELFSLVSLDEVGPAIDRAVFPNTPRALTWTSTFSNYNPLYPWVVNFDIGHVLPGYTTPTEFPIRLVRDGS
ncbi:DUF1566 domain-containing protein [Ideonella sp. 4Y16]|uniref:Lcl C-terminal domain-containing protein n=1 Tax=Ideonella alba TaxID=2824118 RepID=UPI001B3853D6|nr:DUF1566 domain-containing protein [Ideonella alba]MBQ0943037.1 DUF1566 domain-containing protein [Ideonella alba]